MNDKVKRVAYDRKRYDGLWTVRREEIQALKKVPCMDCKGEFPTECMDFDHARGKKLFEINASWSRSREAFLREVSKCDVVCANCHRIRTLKEPWPYRLADRTAQ